MLPTWLPLLLVVAAWTQPPPSDTTLHRSEIRVRDPFVLADPETKTYYLYSSTTHGMDASEPRKSVVVYRSADLERWSAPVTVAEFPPGHWGRETVWAPEVHRYKGRYYLFVTLTSTETLPTPPGRPRNLKRGTEILVADRPEGPFVPLGKGSQTPPDWMALDGTLWVEDGVPYMVFCHEWIQITDGSVDLVRMNDDLSAPVSKPVTLFHASEADWVRCRADLGELFEGKRYHAFITDGPWLHRTRTGRLFMLWSSYGPTKYATGVAVSTSGRITGPWVQQQAPLWLDDGGHPMLFTAFDGRLVMTIHQPNRLVERARFFEVEDTGETIRIVGEVTNAHAPATPLPR
ncbi:Beta-xylosidase [Luteitalea pratensis]|uniref:Beta-xylosidase n=1 Tax=Luteitalea pratensis TaxID=1855912 RepID=A0A143PJZ7_LUTPR|nr:glycoside hydrolase family 43 protein [Luteitalea pratensis]AMY08895.1 Beta-xylosidase [Luteitalea pratensis]